jgi:hypothetical protein
VGIARNTQERNKRAALGRPFVLQSAATQAASGLPEEHAPRASRKEFMVDPTLHIRHAVTTTTGNLFSLLQPV